MSCRAKRNILAVDDDPAVRLVLAEMLDGLDCCATVVGSGRDVVLVDLAMPDMSGAQLLATLRARHPELAVIIMTGLAAAAAKGLFPADAPMWVLGKPFSVSELAAMIRRVLPA